MKLKAALSGRDYEVALDLDKDRASIEIEGRPYEIEIHRLAYAEYLLIAGTNVYKCRVETKRDSRSSFQVIARGESYDITLVDPKRLRSAQTSGAHAPGVAEIVSPMPGKIVRVLVAPGAQVEAGAGIIVVEAMKMQNEMKAPKAGVVTSINAGVGATVNAGDVLAVIE